jgi:hypothetical protein
MGLTQSQVMAAAKPREFPVLRIGRRCGWPALDLPGLWAYRELLYFFIWREIEVRYKQTVIGAVWAVLQHVETMLVFSLFSVSVMNQYSASLIQGTISRDSGPSRKFSLRRL